MTWILSAFLLGLFGSTHCVMMCGGIASALSGTLVSIGRKAKPVRATASYNLGRVVSYVLLGALAGVIGHAIDRIPALADARLVLRLIAGTIVVGAGLYVAGVWHRFALIERIGAPLWSRVRPVASRLFGSTNVLAALAVGALWGLMPCGLVYAAFGLSLASGSAVQGALVMAAFGCGTAPAMLAMGFASARIRPALNARVWLRRTAGVVVLSFGLVDVVMAATSLAQPSTPVCCAGHH